MNKSCGLDVHKDSVFACKNGGFEAVMVHNCIFGKMNWQAYT
jgi:hypothetical protein